jgi:hypothetical protein
MREPTRAIVRLTVSALLLDELGHAPEPGVEVSAITTGRRKVDWYVEVTQEGLDLVSAAVEPGWTRSASRCSGQRRRPIRATVGAFDVDRSATRGPGEPTLTAHHRAV